jgi:hypothetical protein
MKIRTCFLNTRFFLILFALVFLTSFISRQSFAATMRSQQISMDISELKYTPTEDGGYTYTATINGEQVTGHLAAGAVQKPTNSNLNAALTASIHDAVARDITKNMALSVKDDATETKEPATTSKKENNTSNTSQENELNLIGNGKNAEDIIQSLINGDITLCNEQMIKNIGSVLTDRSDITTPEELAEALQSYYYKKTWFSKEETFNNPKVSRSNLYSGMNYTSSVNSVLTENFECVKNKNIKEQKEQKVYTPPQVTITCGDPNNPFNAVLCKGAEFFGYVRTLASLISAFALVAFSVNAIFGNVNWKWFMGVIFGLLVISLTGALVDFIIDSDDAQMSGKYINDTLTD